VWIPKLGWVNMAEKLRFQGKVIGARITRTADWWFISITIEVPDERPEKRHTTVGIDVGLNRLALFRTGEGYENQAFLKTALGKLRQANKRLHRRKPGSKNRAKARRQVARLHYRITCMRDDVLHKLTTRIAQCYAIIGREDLTLKVEQCGGQVIQVGRFFPSSKTCHSCGWKWEDMELSDRIFLCQNLQCSYSSSRPGSGPQCGIEHPARSPSLDRAD
jgi:putative transposase